MANLSKTWTLESALGYLRSQLDEISSDKIQVLPLIDYINLGQQAIAQIVNELKLPDYGNTLVIKASPAGGEVALTIGTPKTDASAMINQDSSHANLRIDSIEKIAYNYASGASRKLAIKVSPYEFENIIAINQKDEEIYWCQIGEKLYFRNFIGTITLDADWGDLQVFYNRYPVKLVGSSLSDYLDVRDGFVNQVLNYAKLFIYEELNIVAAEALINSVTNATDQIRESVSAEYQMLEIAKRGIS
jgi:hypothetical protein